MKNFFVTYTTPDDTYTAYTTIYYDPDIMSVITGHVNSNCDRNSINVIGLSPYMPIDPQVDIFPEGFDENTLYILES